MRRLPGRGFSLLELLAVVTITGILFAAALGAYREQTLRARRADARSALLHAALQQEEQLLRSNRYSGSLRELGGEAGELLSAHGHYRLRLNQDSADCTAHTEDGEFHCYAFTAHPVAGQRRDRHCAVFYLHHDGRRGALDADGREAAGCW